MTQSFTRHGKSDRGSRPVLRRVEPSEELVKDGSTAGRPSSTPLPCTTATGSPTTSDEHHHARLHKEPDRPFRMPLSRRVASRVSPLLATVAEPTDPGKEVADE